ncbi:MULTISPECIES: ribosome maturation factor RimP [unclassified Actinomyces]|uniref:ribosome maturation factor RimP n=1 Tax=unclassified Actinomyces TaxID=2609248 RepID=UPI0013A6989A|nr:MULTISPECIES: ribosome maturation factor RimP [unclassified Actinomyces]MBW3068722.1 ribosome maturation factor RimP [Actinomyces sp. 594]NDR54791.1 ribosome maturation factor RimP [Actinomyces sp. 565]
MTDASVRSQEPGLRQLLAPIVEGAGLFLEDVRLARAGKYTTLRVVVDLADGPGDLDLETLGEVTQSISDAVDAADPVAGQYTLEVTTPGAERELHTPRHFRRAVGHSAVITTAEEQTLQGEVTAADADTVTLSVDDSPRTIALADITAARMVVSM